MALVGPAVPSVESMSGKDNVHTLDVIREVVIDQVFNKEALLIKSAKKIFYIPLPTITVDVTIVADSLNGAPVSVVDLVETPIEGAVGVGTSHGGRVEAGLCVHGAHPGGEGVPGIPSCVHLEGDLTFLESPRRALGRATLRSRTAKRARVAISFVTRWINK